MFLHGSWSHVIGNMWYLWIFGDNVEDRVGHGRFIVFYLLCGIAAALGQIAIDPTSTLPTIGASGAIAGVMGAYFVLYPQSRVLTLIPLIIFWEIIELPAIVLLGFWFLMQLFSAGAIAVTASTRRRRRGVRGARRRFRRRDAGRVRVQEARSQRLGLLSGILVSRRPDAKRPCDHGRPDKARDGRSVSDAVRRQVVHVAVLYSRTPDKEDHRETQDSRGRLRRLDAGSRSRRCRRTTRPRPSSTWRSRSR